MPLLIFTLLALWLGAAPARAQIPPSPVMTEACRQVPQLPSLPPPIYPTEAEVYEAVVRLAAHRNFQPSLAITGIAATARWTRPTFRLVLTPGQGEPWNLAFYTVLVRPERPLRAEQAMANWRPVLEQGGANGPQWMARDGAELARTLAPRQLRDETATRPEAPREIELLLEIDWNARGSFWAQFGSWERFQRFWRQSFEVLVVPCLREGPESPVVYAESFGRTEVTLNNPGLGLIAGVLMGVIVLAIAGFAALAVNGQKLARRGEPPPRFSWRAFTPPFVCQDSYGHFSLAAFQILLFTVALLGVYAYAFVITREAPTVTNSVLALAGITVAGSALATAATRPSLETAPRLWLFGTGVLQSEERMPRWADLVTTDGRVDISRVQALIFSFFAAFTLIFQGSQELDRFELPEQLNLLIGLSQAAYVAGKAIPAEVVRRLNDSVKALMAAETAALEALLQPEPEREAANAAFARLKQGVAPILHDVFGLDFDAKRLEDLPPGGRIAAALRRGGA